MKKINVTAKKLFFIHTLPSPYFTTGLYKISDHMVTSIFNNLSKVLVTLSKIQDHGTAQ